MRPCSSPRTTAPTSTATPLSSTAASAPRTPITARNMDARPFETTETKMSPISTRKHKDVLIVTSNNPPVNALGHAVREGLVAAIAEADGDDAVKAVVIICQGQTFFAGADISEFGTPKSFESPA